MSGNLLIIANSARMLLQATTEQGYSALAIDCFADIDSQKLAVEMIKVDSLAIPEVQEALAKIQQRYVIDKLIYGSGLEPHPSTLQYLDQHYTVIGNSFQLFSKLLDKQYFFSYLKKRHIAHPETVFESPENTDGWLVKPYAGEGGIGIKWAKEKINDSTHYWQKHSAGDCYSVLFLAIGRQYQIIGFHKQFVTKLGDNDFVFSGLINQLQVDPLIIQQIENYLNKLLTEFLFKGINSLDFIVNDNACYLLEINPRPSASLALYDSSLLSAHIASCQSSADLYSFPEMKTYKAFKVVFADHDIYIPKKLHWPEWAVDIPIADSIINTGSPICSIIAGGKTEQQVMDLLALRIQQLLKLLHNRYP